LKKSEDDVLVSLAAARHVAGLPRKKAPWLDQATAPQLDGGITMSVIRLASQDKWLIAALTHTFQIAGPLPVDQWLGHDEAIVHPEPSANWRAWISVDPGIEGAQCVDLFQHHNGTITAVVDEPRRPDGSQFQHEGMLKGRLEDQALEFIRRAQEHRQLWLSRN
jgi:hypothetical protein